jgi:isopentenyl-diphosphate delta-isomerase
MEQVILVDEADNEIGSMEKMEAHRKGVLHRAFSILLYNSQGQLLLQKRSNQKYHSAGLWTNTCCSHPRPKESIDLAARRKLMQEMGIDFQPEFSFKFIYKTALENQLIEHECDHVLMGQYEGDFKINPEEVEDWKYVDVTDLKNDIKQNPENYTFWFKEIMHHPDFAISA